MNDGLETIATILIMNIVYVSLFTIRIILVMKARRFAASLISMVEVFTYLMGLNIVLNSIDNPVNLAAYCIGWGGGVWLGIKIEEWLALGYVTLQIVVESSSNRLPVFIREQGFGVTNWLAEGKDGPRLIMEVLTKRNQEKYLLRILREVAPKAFIISYEPRAFHGGFWAKYLKTKP
ncbi:MAG: DUF2179 domain-containing protein [Candidatus Pristimantibacillus sp.]